MSHEQINDDLYIDLNGCPTELVEINGQAVVIHYDDIPESDITTVHGVRCTTALRTVIDVAAGLERDELEEVVRHCLDRGLFTREEAMARVARPDLSPRLGAQYVRRIVSR
jgi:hypothetical protein